MAPAKERSGSFASPTMMKLYYDLKHMNGYTTEEIDRKRLALEGVSVPVTAHGTSNHPAARVSTNRMLGYSNCRQPSSGEPSKFVAANWFEMPGVKREHR